MDQRQVPTYFEEQEKAKFSFHAELIWLKEFIELNPDMMPVGAHELRQANGRVKEAHQNWSTNALLPSAHPWRKALPDRPNSQIRMKSWVEILTSKGPKRSKPRSQVATGDRYRQPSTSVKTFCATKLRVRKGKLKNQHTQNLRKHFIQASSNRGKRHKKPSSMS